MKYKYLLGGITLGTDIHLPELLESGNKIDVEVKYGVVADNLEVNKVDFPFIQANETQYLLKLPDMAKYLVENGNSITIQPEKYASAKEVNRYILTNLFTSIAHQRNMLPMHGGVFIFKGKAIMITGSSGNGKSAILAALYKKGFPVIADDVSIVKMIEGKPFVLPSFPRIMLWKDTIQDLGLDKTLAYKLRHDMKKYFLPLNATHFNSPVALEKIIVLRSGGNPYKKNRLAGLQKVEELKNNVHHPWMANLFNKRDNSYLSQALSLSSLINMYVLENDRIKGIDEVADVLLNMLADAE